MFLSNFSVIMFIIHAFNKMAAFNKSAAFTIVVKIVNLIDICS